MIRIQRATLKTMALFDFKNSLFLILTSLGASTALYLLYSTVRAIFSQLRGIPGPFVARFTRFWKLREIYKGSFEKTNTKLHQKYGKSRQKNRRTISSNFEEQAQSSGLLQMNIASMIPRP